MHDGDGEGRVTCPGCGQETPSTPFCIRCGTPLADRDGRPVHRGYAADPAGRTLSLDAFTTFLPQLPRDDLLAFRLALLAGLVVVVALAVVGFFPLALVASALLVPLVMVVYLYDVDVYEDEPYRVYVFTFAWGAVLGAVLGLLLRALVQVDPLGPPPGIDFVLARGVGVPLIAGALMLAGPLLLLRYPRFNDMLDGATFGATSATAFVGAQVIAQSVDLLGAGLRPGGDTVLWIARLLAQGVALPLIAGGAIGAACGAFWLRYRAPVADRSRLGLLGQPAVALAGAAALLVLAELARIQLREIPALVVQAILAAVALLWLRLVIHHGLIQESLEQGVGRDLVCGNCGRSTPSHTFCGECGVALRALPKARRGATAAAVAEPPPADAPPPAAAPPGAATT